MEHGIELHMITEIKKKNPTVVMGFPGVGLVGSVAASQLIDVLNMDFIGYISSPQFAPLAAIHDYVPMPPVRIHYSEKYNIMVVISEMSIPVNATIDLAEKLFDDARKMQSAQIISMGGISLKEEEGAVYLVSSEKKIAKSLIARKLVKPIREGATTGVIGLMLSRGVVEKFPVISILAESSEESLDPKAAANVLRVLGLILGIPIDTGILDKEAKEMNKALKETMIKSKIKKVGEGTMYG
jgi:uncharacterized protein